ncbi:MerR family transcriptional regulator [Kineococcus sp. SYSU DK005]|uniref:MerR family transcriptional regulator n=1 Tax=Kineococcus sp. SYSU DK005 TaxID=3383126 RepID=UPI003D7EB6EC
MRIGEVAAAAGVSVRVLRYYEEQGLLSAQRSPSGQRHYGETAVDRVKLIQQLYAAGLSSKAVAKLLPCVDTKTSTPEVRGRLKHERERIDRQIQELLAARAELDKVIHNAENPGSGYTYVA